MEQSAASQHDGRCRPAMRKRRRIAAACSSCRCRKTRCDGIRPVCGLCDEYGLPCSFEDPAARSKGNASNVHARSSQPRDVIPPDSTESRLAVVEATLRQVLQKPQAPLMEQTAPGTDETEHEHACGYEAIGTIPGQDGEVEQLVDLIDGLATIPSGITVRDKDIFFGPSSNIALLRTASVATHRLLERWTPCNAHSNASVGDPLIPQLSSKATEIRSQLLISEPICDYLVLPTEHCANELLEKYFKGPGILFPFVQESYVRERLAHCFRNGRRGLQLPFMGLLNAMFALATYVRGTGPFPSPEEASFEASSLYFRRAHTIISRLSAIHPTIETVQCLLILCQYTQGIRSSFQTCALHRMALQLSLQLGLHANSWSANSDVLDREVRKRTWINCVILDKILSAGFGRPQAISSHCGRVDAPLNCDLDDLANDRCRKEQSRDGPTINSVCCFTATAELCQILSKVISKVYADNIEGSASQSLSETLQDSLLFDTELCQWEAGLPRVLKLTPWKDDYIAIPKVDPVFEKLSTVMRLRYLNVRILKERPVLNWLLERKGASNSAGEIECSEDGHLLSLSVIHTRKLCETATEIVTIVFAQSHKRAALGAWWFSVSYVFHACAVLFGYLLLNFYFITQRPAGTAEADSWYDESNSLLDIVETLRKGCLATETLLQGTHQLHRIQLTLGRIVQTADTLMISLKRLSQQHLQRLHPNASMDLFTESAAFTTISMTEPGPRTQSTPPFDVSSQEMPIASTELQQDPGLSLDWQNWVTPDLDFWSTFNADSIDTNHYVPM